MSKMTHTPGPWEAGIMVHKDTGEPLTPAQVGEYIQNSVTKSAVQSGSLDFYTIRCEKPDGQADVCHVGNGPTSPANALLIAAAPLLFDELGSLLERYSQLAQNNDYWNPDADAHVLSARVALGIAKGHVQPESVDAVDPVAASSRRPSTRA